jgi:hypothetical protein
VGFFSPKSRKEEVERYAKLPDTEKIQLQKLL